MSGHVLHFSITAYSIAQLLCEKGNANSDATDLDATFVIRREVGVLLSFSLSFCFNSDVEIDTVAFRVASSSEVLDKILAMDVQQEVEIAVMDNVKSTHKEFQSLVHSIANAKNWHCLNDDGFYRDEPTSSKMSFCRSWNWILRPTPQTRPSAASRYLDSEMWAAEERSDNEMRELVERKAREELEIEKNSD